MLLFVGWCYLALCAYPILLVAGLRFAGWAYDLAGIAVTAAGGLLLLRVRGGGRFRALAAAGAAAAAVAVAGWFAAGLLSLSTLVGAGIALFSGGAMLLQVVALHALAVRSRWVGVRGLLRRAVGWTLVSWTLLLAALPAMLLPGWARILAVLAILGVSLVASAKLWTALAELRRTALIRSGSSRPSPRAPGRTGA
jgi:hypothetical protein